MGPLQPEITKRLPATWRNESENQHHVRMYCALSASNKLVVCHIINILLALKVIVRKKPVVPVRRLTHTIFYLNV